MSRRAASPWLVMGPGETLATCQRCGEVYEKPPMPMPFNLFVALLQGILALHKGCKETADAAPRA